MGYYEALEDGIEISGDCYIVYCRVCGKRLRRVCYKRELNYTCEECKEITKNTEKPEKTIEKEIKFRNAVSRIELMVKDVKKYQKAIETVHKTIDHVGWYQSTEEIMAAIELTQKGVKAIHQQKVGKYKVDFLLPEYKVVLEIDGKMFHNEHTRAKEGIRDGNILLNLGFDWEIIRIDTDKINKNIKKLVPAIENVLAHRKSQKKHRKIS